MKKSLFLVMLLLVCNVWALEAQVAEPSSRLTEIYQNGGTRFYSFNYPSKGVGGEEAGWRKAVERRGRAHEHHIRLPLAYRPERGEPLADEVLMRAERVVGQRFPVRKQHAAQRRRKKADFLLQAARIGGIGADDGKRTPVSRLALRQLCQQQRIAGRRRARHHMAARGFEGRKFHGQQGGKNGKSPRPACGRGRTNETGGIVGQGGRKMHAAKCILLKTRLCRQRMLLAT